MKVLLAPAQFKESISAGDVASCWQQALVERGISSVSRPISDGGEGFLDAFLNAGGTEVKVSVTDALGQPVESSYVLAENTAYVQMSRASGLEQIPPDQRDPLRSSTFGTGVLIKHAIGTGVNKVVVGLGGSATNDGGLGIFQALGGKLMKGAQALEYLWDIDNNCVLETRDFPAEVPDFTAATDVQNPLLGSKGATWVYAEQKGLSPELFPEMDRKMALWADLVEGWKGAKFRDLPGTGAAGGLGFGLMGLFNASLEPGFDIISTELNLEDEINRADIVITGEGKMDSQSEYGKAPFRLIQLCRRLGKPVWVIAGHITHLPDGIAGSCSLTDLAGSAELAMKHPALYLSEAVKLLMMEYLG